MRNKIVQGLLLLSLLIVQPAYAKLEVCNATDLVMLVAIAHGTPDGHIKSEGWWKVYPGFCEVPANINEYNGTYYLHAESSAASTMPGDNFSWGQAKPLCVSAGSDFELFDAEFCATNNTLANFNSVKVNSDNTSTINIVNSSRTYQNSYRSKIAGIQRLLSILGNDIGDIDGVLGEKTVDLLNEIALQSKNFAFDFEQIYPALEQKIIDEQFPEN